MDEKDDKPVDITRVARETHDRVTGMGEDQRTELAAKFVRRKRPLPPAPARPVVDGPDPAVAAKVARLQAELSQAERRLDRLEATLSRSRHQRGGGSPAPSARYLRLLSRADRLERELRSLR